MYRRFGKRAFDIFFSFSGILILFPLMMGIFFLILLTDGWPVFYVQERVGRYGKIFRLIKFRTMYQDSDKKGLLTVGGMDSRVTGIGYYLRKYKLDELPQLINVWKGDMSLVGPRPEVRKYVDLYTQEQRRVLELRPGLTDWASIKFYNENEILSRYENPEEGYIKEIMPEKLKINLAYLEKVNLWNDIRILWSTFLRVI